MILRLTKLNHATPNVTILRIMETVSRRHGTHHNDIQHNDTQLYDIQHNNEKIRQWL
jgi:hypothetical protein